MIFRLQNVFSRKYVFLFLDTRTGPCHLSKGTGPNSCSNVVADDVLRSRCCCSVGAAWNEPCEECPKNGTGEDYALIIGTLGDG